jgi:hypothetical protein
MRNSILLGIFLSSTIFATIPDSGNPPNAGGLYATAASIPGKSFTAAGFWFTAATNKIGVSNNGSVMVDWVQIFEVNASGDTTLFITENYDSPHNLSDTEGGLFSRPFKPNDKPIAFPPNTATVSGGSLSIAIGNFPENMCHWWLKRQTITPTSKYIIKVRVLITGDISFRTGVDFWLNDICKDSSVNHQEAWVSSWVNSSSWQIITAQFHDAPVGNFVRNKDYGVTTDGTFFISARLAWYGGWHELGDSISVFGDGDAWGGKHMMTFNSSDSIFRYKYSHSLSVYNPIEYCFSFAGDQWIPEEAWKLGKIDTVDIKSNPKKNGHNFYTRPISSAIHSIPSVKKVAIKSKPSFRRVNALGRNIKEFSATGLYLEPDKKIQLKSK